MSDLIESIQLNNCHKQWWKDPGLRKLNLLICFVMLSPITTGYDAALMANLQAIPRWAQDIGLPTSQRIGLMVAAQSLGGIIGLIPVSSTLDAIGRRYTIMIGDVILFAAALGQNFSYDWKAVFISRIVLGIGSMMTLAAAPVLITELAHPRQRGTVVSTFGSYFFLGSIIASWTTFGMLRTDLGRWMWRLPVLLQIAIPLIQFFGMILVPESPRWLIAKGRKEEAKNILADYHANGKLDEYVCFEYEEIHATIEREKQLARSSWMEFARTSGNRKRLAIIAMVAIFSMWTGSQIIAFYLIPVLRNLEITSSTQQAGINGGLQIFNWTVAIISASMVDKLGRRKLWLTSGFTMLSVLVLLIIAASQFAQHEKKSAAYSFVVLLFLYNLGYAIAYPNVGPMYVAEINPYHLRGKGMSLFYGITYAAGFFNAYVNPIALHDIGWKYYIFYVPVLIFSIIMFWLVFPETRNRTVEEVALIFDKTEADAVN